MKKQKKVAPAKAKERIVQDEQLRASGSGYSIATGKDGDPPPEGGS